MESSYVRDKTLTQIFNYRADVGDPMSDVLVADRLADAFADTVAGGDVFPVTSTPIATLQAENGRSFQSRSIFGHIFKRGRGKAVPALKGLVPLTAAMLAGCDVRSEPAEAQLQSQTFLKESACTSAYVSVRCQELWAAERRQQRFLEKLDREGHFDKRLD